MSTYSEHDIQQDLNAFHGGKTTLIYLNESLYGFHDTVEKYRDRTIVAGMPGKRRFHAKVSTYIVLFRARKMHKS
jgi:hypothetical protein